MSSLMWALAALVGMVGALQWAQGAPVVGVFLVLVGIGLAPLSETRTFRRQPR